MAKSSVDQIYKDELKIVSELKKNARESIENIAKKLNFSRQKVWRIINKLDENKKIWGYTAISDPKFSGHNSYFILIKRNNKPIDNKNIDIVI